MTEDWHFREAFRESAKDAGVPEGEDRQEVNPSARFCVIRKNGNETAADCNFARTGSCCRLMNRDADVIVRTGILSGK